MNGDSAPVGQALAEDGILDRVASIAESLGDARLRAEALALRERVAEGRFYVACFGEFKRGKSTLLNALVGEPLLPAGIVPVTAVPTILRFGDHPRARVRTREVGWHEIPLGALDQYVSESLNPENAKGVDVVEVFVSSPLLRGGMSLVDTPGVGSVFSANTVTAEGFVPHIDAAVMLIGVDPPISGEELALLARVRQEVPDVLVVLGKADRHTEAERAQAVAFADRVLGRAVLSEPGEGPQPPWGRILQVSGAAALRGETGAYDWKQLVDSLQQLEARSGPALVRSALGRGVVRIIDGLRGDVVAARDALQRPLTDSERRVEALRQVSAESAHRVARLRHLLDAEEEQLALAFEQHRQSAREQIEGTARQQTVAAISAARAQGIRGPRLRRLAIDAAADACRDALGPWLANEARTAEAMYRTVEKRFVSVANDFLNDLWRAASSGAPPDERFRVDGFRVRSRFYFTHRMTVAAPVAPATWLVDLMSSGPRMECRAERAAGAYLHRLIETNSAGVTQDLRERVRESRRELEADVRKILLHVYESAERALSRARALHATGAEAVSDEVERLENIRLELDQLAPGRT